MCLSEPCRKWTAVPRKYSVVAAAYWGEVKEENVSPDLTAANCGSKGTVVMETNISVATLLDSFYGKVVVV